MGVELKFAESDVREVYFGSGRRRMLASLHIGDADGAAKYSPDLFLQTFTAVRGAFGRSEKLFNSYLEGLLGKQEYELFQSSIDGFEGTYRALVIEAGAYIMPGLAEPLIKEAQSRSGSLFGRKSGSMFDELVAGHFGQLRTFAGIYITLSTQRPDFGKIAENNGAYLLRRRNPSEVLKTFWEIGIGGTLNLLLIANMAYGPRSSEFLSTVKGGKMTQLIGGLYQRLYPDQ
ncbi:hypothetical protein HYU16_04710 [Candidatus Woesearchaeota archaeon]|nr:hypothetical protein [Candidatus Woesearchaeota archaeon]